MTAVPQHLNALAKANEVRLARAETKRRIKRGEVSVAALVLEPPPELMTISVSELLCAQRRWGGQRAFATLNRVPIPSNKHLGTLTNRQRIRLALLLGPKGSDGDDNAA